MRHVAESLAAGCLAAALTGCQPNAPAPSTPQLSAPTTATSAARPAPVGKTTVVDGGEYNFHSPTGNISCGMLDHPAIDIVSVRCDIAQRRYQSPPSARADCPVAVSFNSIAVGAADPADFLTCVTDTVAGGSATLAYGDSVRVGRFLCTSRENGMNCENTQNHHGFDLAKDSFRRH